MILGTICARGGSRGVPGKNMRSMNGWPLIDTAVTCAQKCESLDKIIISSDDNKVKEYATMLASIDFQPRPPELATDTASKWDVFRYIAEQNELKQDDILVDLDVGCPLREPQDITACVEKLRGGNYDVVATAYESDRNPYFNMVEEGGGGHYYVFASGEHNHLITRRQDAPVVYSLSPAVFAIKAWALFKYKHWSEARLGIVVIPRERAWDVDTPLDFEIVEFLMKGK